MCCTHKQTNGWKQNFWPSLRGRGNEWYYLWGKKLWTSKDNLAFLVNEHGWKNGREFHTLVFEPSSQGSNFGPARNCQWCVAGKERLPCVMSFGSKLNQVSNLPTIVECSTPTVPFTKRRWPIADPPNQITNFWPHMQGALQHWHSRVSRKKYIR